MIGNAYKALSLLTRSRQIPLGFLHIWSVSSCKDGYKFGYRHQFGLITVNYAKLLNDRHLRESNIPLNCAYLSQTYGYSWETQNPPGFGQAPQVGASGWNFVSFLILNGGQRRLWSVLQAPFPGTDNRNRTESSSGYRG
jgi:hypothetical protein